jgi:hypothetical protein
MSIGKRFFEKTMQELLQTIKEYDSDTFFAKGSDLTEEEAYDLAARCIHNFIDNRLDGVLLDSFLSEIRGN